MKRFVFIVTCLTVVYTAKAQDVMELYPKDVHSLNYLSNEEAQKWKPEENEAYDSYWSINGSACSWYCGGSGPKKIEASSHLQSQGNNNYDEKNLHDDLYNTPWVEGVSGYGEGEWVKYTLRPNMPRITKLLIVNGYVKSQTAWKNNSRVKRLKFYVNDKPIAILNLEDSRSEQIFEFEPMSDTVDWTMKFEILEVYKGEKYDDTALSEIYFDGIDVHCFAAGTKVLLADNSPKNIEDIKQGDKIMTYNSITGKKGTAIVEKTAAVTHKNLVTYVFEGGNKITATDDHPFLTEQGWASSNPAKTANYKGFEKVEQIKVGDSFATANGYTKLVSKSVSPESEMTYTIVKLSAGNTFYANDIIVGVEEVK